jgi:Flp pilus assembly protein TadG
MSRWQWWADHPEDGGAPSTQAAQLFPVLMLVLVAVIAGGRVSNAHDAADQAARAAARIASIQRDPTVAQAASTTAATTELSAQGLRCGAVTVNVDTTGLTTPLGQPSTVTATVSCQVSLSELAFPGIPGDRTLTASFTSPVDPNRERP